MAHSQAFIANSAPGVNNDLDLITGPEFFMRLPEYMKSVTKLNNTGSNIQSWEQQLKVTIRNVTWLDHSYLNGPAPLTINAKLDRLVFSMVYWSVDEQLQIMLNIDGSAEEAFRMLRHQSERLEQSPASKQLAPRSAPKHLVQEQPTPKQPVLEQPASKQPAPKQPIREQPKVRTPLALADLPDEVLERIFGILYLQSSLEVNVGQNKIPTLSLEAVSKRFYRLGCPWLWKNLKLSMCKDKTWLHRTLVQYGMLVESIDVTISIERNQVSGNRIFSMSDFRRVIEACPHAQSVTIRLPWAVQQYSVLCEGLTAAISSASLLGRVTDLNLISPASGGNSGQILINAMQDLPDLVSLSCSSFFFSVKEDVEQSFGWNLAQLKNLRKLQLKSLDCQDGTWNMKSWLDRLQTLKIVDCIGLSPLRIHELLSGFALQVTRLTLKVVVNLEHPQLSSSAQFTLPALTQLTLGNGIPFFSLSNFRECKDLKRLDLCWQVKDDCNIFLGLEPLHTWPNFKLLDFRHPEVYSRELKRHPGFSAALRKVLEYCKQSDIEVRLE